jgi:hypothetical protein
MAEFPVVKFEVTVVMPQTSRDEDVDLVMSLAKRMAAALQFTARTVLPVWLKCRIDVEER